MDTMQMRRRLLLAGSLATGWAWAARARAANRLPALTIALTARNSLYHLPLVLAEDLGFFRQRGLPVHFLDHDSGASAVASVLQGRADVLAGAFEHLFEMQRQGQFFQAFLQMADTPMLSVGVATARLAPRSWQDLRGLRWGVSALDSQTHWLSSLWLLRQGLLPQEVDFVEVGTSASAMDAVWQGRVDVLCNPDPVMHWLEQRGDLRLIAQARTPAGTRQWAGGDLPGGCLMVRESQVQRQADAIAALTEAVLQALRWMRTAGPVDLFKRVPAAPWLSDRSVYLGAFEKLRDSYSRDGLVREDAVFNAWRMHARVATQLPLNRQWLERSFTHQFARQALQGLRPRERS